jgi:hypothetical protein
MLPALTLAVLLALPLVAGPVRAGTLVLTTSPMVVDVNVSYVRCNVANVGAAPFEVTVQSIDGGGAIQDGGTLTLDPGVTYTATFGFDIVSYCKFSIPVGKSKKKRPAVRANACLAVFALGFTCQELAEAR